MEFVADFHIHSKYSRATSKDMDVEHLSYWAKLKGIQLIGSGDFTHHLWLEELRSKLEDKGNGLYEYKGINFILSSEISSIYSKNNRGRRIHNIIFAPSFRTVDKINTRLAAIGNLASDGRPILGLDAAELARIIFDIDPNCFIVPAHCLLPETLVHAKDGLKKIKDIVRGDEVYTHKLNYKKVTQVLNRSFQGKLYHIRPYYFREGLKTTPEHPFYVIKTRKDCRWIGGICRPNCSEVNNCKRRYFQTYKPQWLCAKNINKGDILLFPRFNNEIKNINSFKISVFLDKQDFFLNNKKIYPRGYKSTKINNEIRINQEFCRLAGYFISEGYTNGRDCISFSFHDTEKEYIKDVQNLMKNIFDVSFSRIQIKETARGVELIYYSKILLKLFSKFFYIEGSVKRAHSKSLPGWILNLPVDKQAEVIKGWWRGDTGYTSSRVLMNQMKIIFLRLGIIPSIRRDSKEAYTKRGKHKIGERRIKVNYDSFQFSNLSFFSDEYGLLKDSSLERFKTKLKRRHGWLDDRYIYLPIRDIETENYKGEVYNLEVDEDNSYVAEFAVIHNCWTPWFSLFGSASGFDRIEDCFEEQTPKIFALETGLSSDPGMNWRWSALDRFSLISNSDAHSPSKIGREANVFDCELSYQAIMEALRTKDKSKFLYTIEFYPEEGKYHYDGHRLCGVRFSPQESKAHKNLCPKCAKPLTIGVMNRVDQLADRPEGFKPDNAIPFKNLIPLDEIIADVKGMGKASKAVEQEYRGILVKFGTEFEVLGNVSEEDLRKGMDSRIAEAIIRARQGKVNIAAGYDGEYGKISIFGDDEKPKKHEEQLSLF